MVIRYDIYSNKFSIIKGLFIMIFKHSMIGFNDKFINLKHEYLDQ